MGADIRFPNLGITIDSLGKSISVGGFSIAYYGIIIAVGMIAGFYMASWQAKRLGQNSEVILDLALWDIFFAIIGARLYYVIFSWDYYCEHPAEIFNIRGGGMAIYGGVIAGVLTTFVFAKVKKLSFGELTDAASSGLLVGQIFGRWGNFFNREVFGGYTDNLFAMQLKQSQVRSSDVNTDLLRHLVDIDGVKYIQVHPTFLYESLWNLLLLIVILLWTKKRKFGGQLFLMYLFGYGLGRFWIEGIRVDQLMLFGTGIPVSQLLSGLLAVISGGILVFKFWKMRKAGNAA
ncbi:prolipoprotein diacylglyceryl transferase [bacterium 1xD8-6]|jgi:prolipoprotein diacylglyceryl transferase|nr:prolipoprotein diacylglyceryl transferase [bacterium D16-36]RKI66686.1 prolipoprotein diacylglyceryl transferase [bacterium 1xD8-6]